MKRTIHIKLSYSIVIDDDQEGLPYIRDPSEVALNGVRGVKGLTEIKPGTNLDMRIDRADWNEMRKRDRVRRMNER